MLKYQRQASLVMVELKEVIMLMLKQSVNLSMCAVLIPILEDWSSLASFVQMGPCSIRSTLFVNIGSMLTAPVLSHSSTSMKTLEIFLKIL